MKLGTSTVWHVQRAALRRRKRWLYFVPCPLYIGEPSPCPYLYDFLLSAINFDDESASGCTDKYVTTVDPMLVKLIRTLISILRYFYTRYFCCRPVAVSQHRRFHSGSNRPPLTHDPGCSPSARAPSLSSPDCSIT